MQRYVWNKKAEAYPPGKQIINQTTQKIQRVSQNTQMFHEANCQQTLWSIYNLQESTIYRSLSLEIHSEILHYNCLHAKVDIFRISKVLYPRECYISLYQLFIACSKSTCHQEKTCKTMLNDAGIHITTMHRVICSLHNYKTYSSQKQWFQYPTTLLFYQHKIQQCKFHHPNLNNSR